MSLFASESRISSTRIGHDFVAAEKFATMKMFERRWVFSSSQTANFALTAVERALYAFFPLVFSRTCPISGEPLRGGARIALSSGYVPPRERRQRGNFARAFRNRRRRLMTRQRFLPIDLVMTTSSSALVTVGRVGPGMLSPFAPSTDSTPKGFPDVE